MAKNKTTSAMDYTSGPFAAPKTPSAMNYNSGPYVAPKAPTTPKATTYKPVVQPSRTTDNIKADIASVVGYGNSPASFK
jgi:hypothetical protein